MHAYNDRALKLFYRVITNHGLLLPNMTQLAQFTTRAQLTRRKYDGHNDHGEFSGIVVPS